MTQQILSLLTHATEINLQLHLKMSLYKMHGVKNRTLGNASTMTTREASLGTCMTPTPLLHPLPPINPCPHSVKWVDNTP